MPVRAGLGLLVVALATGCNQRPPTYLVHGMVVYPDGKPLTKGTVEFEAMNQSKPITATGEINSDGSFQLGTFEAKDGAIAGTHRVAVISDFVIGTGVERPDEIPPPKLHPRYREFKTSGLEFKIKPQTNNILVEVDYAPTKAAESKTESKEPNPAN